MNILRERHLNSNDLSIAPSYLTPTDYPQREIKNRTCPVTMLSTRLFLTLMLIHSLCLHTPVEWSIEKLVDCLDSHHNVCV